MARPAARPGSSRPRAAALRYRPEAPFQDAAPRLVAKGQGLLAERILELAKSLPTTARELQSDPGRGFAGNALVERINALIEQRCALTIRRLTDPAEKEADANPSA